MKRRILPLVLLAVVSGFVSVRPAEANASYPSKVVGTCPRCGAPIYAHYKPVRYSDGSVRYVWVPVPHSGCRSR